MMRAPTWVQTGTGIGTGTGHMGQLNLAVFFLFSILSLLKGLLLLLLLCVAAAVAGDMDKC